ITIKGIYIIILQADHIVFNEASLVQIIGRVGRNIEMPTGEGYFLCTRKTKDITACIQTLENMNRGVI
ncbi:MAG: helicase, partial [Longicatena sp.]